MDKLEQSLPLAPSGSHPTASSTLLLLGSILETPQVS